MGFLLPALIVVLLDQASKQFFWILGKNFDVIDSVFRITLVRNSGAAFGMLQGGRIFLIFSSVIAATFIIFLAQRIPAQEKAKKIFLGMILGGALGNGAYGQVVSAKSKETSRQGCPLENTTS